MEFQKTTFKSSLTKFKPCELGFLQMLKLLKETSSPFSTNAIFWMNRIANSNIQVVLPYCGNPRGTLKSNFFPPNKQVRTGYCRNCTPRCNQTSDLSSEHQNRFRF